VMKSRRFKMTIEAYYKFPICIYCDLASVAHDPPIAFVERREP
jgi:hypothetical protein